MCLPGCTSYTTQIPCINAHLYNSTEPVRSVCVWIDQYYIATITAAVVNLIAIVVLNSVRMFRRIGPGALGGLGRVGRRAVWSWGGFGWVGAGFAAASFLEHD